MAESPACTIIHSKDFLCHMLDTLKDSSTSQVSMFVDLEGINISRHGTIAILQLYVLPQNHVYLIDIHALQGQAFSTTATDGVTSIKTVLESETILKAFFDMRNDSDALFAHFGIRLAGVQDIQLMELATRSGSRRFVNGLDRCVEKDAHLSWAEQREWKIAMDKGLFKIAPERGGRHQAFHERPLALELVLYCVQEVRFLPQLYSYYQTKLSTTWMAIVVEATNDRITLSHGANYDGKGRHMILGPHGWY